MPKISLIIPLYNNQATIKECLNSIFSQSFEDFEIIVVNDGSSDKSLEILKEYGDKLKIINQKNQGAPVARNNGFKESLGKYLLFCDADVVLRKKALEKMLYILENHPHADYVYSSFYWSWKKFELNPFSPAKLKLMPYIHTTSLIKRKYFPGFSPEIKKFQDWDLWLTMLEQGHIGVWIPEVLYTVRTKDGRISSWLPSFIYKFSKLKSKNIKKYNEAKKIIFNKHNLTIN